MNRESPETKAWWENAERMTREQGTDNEELRRVRIAFAIAIAGGVVYLAVIANLPQSKNAEIIASYLLVAVFAPFAIVGLIRG